MDEYDLQLLDWIGCQCLELSKVIKGSGISEPDGRCDQVRRKMSRFHGALQEVLRDIGAALGMTPDEVYERWTVAHDIQMDREDGLLRLLKAQPSRQ